MPKGWRDIQIQGLAYPYEISTTGQVRNKKTGNIVATFLTGVKRENVAVILRFEGNGHTYSLPRLVMENFGTKVPTGKRILFKNGNKQDCRLANLYCLPTKKAELSEVLTRRGFHVGLSYDKVMKLIWKELIPDTQDLIERRGLSTNSPSQDWGMRSRWSITHEEPTTETFSTDEEEAAVAEL